MKHKGFTLIELLVVIAIIGILATVVITSLSQARSKARDARRHSDIRQIQNALEVYYLEHGEYPTTLGMGLTYRINSAFNVSSSGNTLVLSSDSSWDALEGVMGVVLPRDPLNETGGTPISVDPENRFNYAYLSYSNPLSCPAGQSYLLMYRLESGPVSGVVGNGVAPCPGYSFSESLLVGGRVYTRNGGIVAGVSPTS